MNKDISSHTIAIERRTEHGTEFVRSDVERFALSHSDAEGRASFYYLPIGGQQQRVAADASVADKLRWARSWVLSWPNTPFA